MNSQYYKVCPTLHKRSNETLINEVNAHPLAYQILMSNPNYIRWDVLELNKKNFPIYYKHPEKITWNALTHNPLLKKLIRTDINKISW